MTMLTARAHRMLLVSCAPIAFAGTAYGQTTPAPDRDEDIVVTGSRLPSADRTSSAPVTILDRGEIDATGATNVGELLRELPVASAAGNEAAGRGNNGAATVALRGLSPVNTLVLINGRRVLSNNEGGTVDLNSIPFEAVERVEVLQDGASAIYGSDAIAGVVNIIMRTDFDGLLLKGSAGISSRGDLPDRQLSATFGKRFDRGGFVFNGSWREADGNFIADRPISPDPDWRYRGGRNFRDPLPVVAVVQGLDPAHPNRELILRDGVTQPTSVSDFRDFIFPDTGTPLSSGNDGINYFRYETSAADISQMNLWFSGDYNVGSDITAFAEASFNRRKSLGYLAPDYFGAVYGDPIILAATNDFNPFGIPLSVARTIGEQPVHGRRQNNVTANTFRVVAGLKGKLGGWNWDLSYNAQELDQYTFAGEGVLRDRLIQAAGDSAACRAAGNGCVPINLLGGPGSITPTMLDFLSADSFNQVRSSLQSVVGNLNGTLFSLPAGDVAFAVGAEYRREVFSLDWDTNSENNAFIARSLVADARPPARAITEVYAELAIPILKDTPFFYRLDVEVAGRFSHYNAFGNTTNPKIGVKWRPMRDLLLRGSWGTGFRAPTFIEAFGGQARGFQPIQDPCATANFATYPGCGGRQAPSNTTGAFTLSGGNPDLEPEDAENITLGAVLTPKGIRGLALTVDFYRIKKKNIIGTIDRNFILLRNAIDGSYADRVTRDPGNNSVTQIIATRDNLLDQQIQGIDIGLQYDTARGPVGRFGFRADLTYLDSFKQSPAPGAAKIERVGTYTDALGTLARFRGTGRINWDLGNLSASYGVRYTGPVTNLGSLLVNGKNLRAEAYIQHDIQVSYLVRGRL